MTSETANDSSVADDRATGPGLLESDRAGVSAGPPPEGGDWPEEVWAAVRTNAVPLTWVRAQRLAARVCRAEGLSYGRDSVWRVSKSKRITNDLHGDGWELQAKNVEDESQAVLVRAEQKGLWLPREPNYWMFQTCRLWLTGT